MTHAYHFAIHFAMTAFVLLFLSAAPARAREIDDPLKSPMWKTLSERYFGTAPVVLDDRVKVSVPSIIENQAQVPVTADARTIDDVIKLIVFADLNPIQLTLELEPRKAKAFAAFRMKIEQSTPVRAAALTRDGTWHVGGIYLTAAGGGCTAPPKDNGGVSWFDTLGNSQGRLWREGDGSVRARFSISHPMDTGLGGDNTPAYYIETLEAKDPSGNILAHIAMFEPVSQNPTLTLILDMPHEADELSIDSRDNNGVIFRSKLSMAAKAATDKNANRSPRAP